MANSTSYTNIILKQRKIRILQLRLQHYSQAEIADMVGLDRSTVNRHLKKVMGEIDNEFTSEKTEYRKFLLIEAESAARRLHDTIKAIPITDVFKRMKVEEQIRANMALREKLTKIEKELPTPVTNVMNVNTNIDIQSVIAEIDAWVPPPEQVEQKPVVVLPVASVASEGGG